MTDLTLIVKSRGDRLTFGIAVPADSTVNDVLLRLGRTRCKAKIVRDAKAIGTHPGTFVKDNDKLTLTMLKRH